MDEKELGIKRNRVAGLQARTMGSGLFSLGNRGVRR